MTRHLRSALLVALLPAICAAPFVFFSTTARAYEHNAVLWNPETSPVPVELFDSGVDDLSVEDLEEIVLASFETWNSVPCSWILLAYIGRTDRHVETDDRQILEWIEAEDEWVYGSMAAGANIAFVYDDPETPEHEDPMVDIAFNGVNFTWVVGGGTIRESQILDPQAVLTHELGHFLGLAHTRDSNASTMAPAYIPDAGQRSLALDDKVGMCEKYWVEASECEDDADCPREEACVVYESEAQGASVRLCKEHHGTFGDPCGADALICTDLCLFSRSDFSEGTCSTHCETNDDCPCDWSCRNLQTADNPFLVCRDTPPDGGDTCEVEDLDAGMNDDADQDAEIDADDNTTDDADSSQPDAVDDTVDDGAMPPAPPSGEGDCDCAALPSRGDTTPAALLTAALVALIVSATRRRT